MTWVVCEHGKKAFPCNKIIAMEGGDKKAALQKWD